MLFLSALTLTVTHGDRRMEIEYVHCVTQIETTDINIVKKKMVY